VRKSIFFSVIFSLTCIAHVAPAQVSKDSVEKQSITKKAFREGMKLISTNPNDTIVGEKSTDAYEEYAGRIIRNITIDRIGFEKSIYDSAKKVDRTITNLANKLHVDTRTKIIRKHLFIKENQPLNPYKLADNERFLRDKDFILDSRIVVVPIEGTDSVDLTVITRDVFSLGGTFGGSFPTAPKIGIYDANVDGRGQRIEFTALIDQDRTPKFGYSLFYRKSSILGSLTNLEVGYSQINTGVSIGEEPEFAMLVRLYRPLVSPYSRLAGGIELSRNWSKNVYNDPDTAFLNYKYKIFDGWIGYNIGIRRKIQDRNRLFLAVRYFNGYYVDQPEQPEYQEEVKYNNGFGYLTEFTFYRQDYFKTRYVFGFGRTEDIPYGINISISGGYIRQVHLERPYLGLKADYSKASRKGNFVTARFQTGAYFREQNLEDNIIQGKISFTTRLVQLKRYKMRNYVSASYAQLNNRTVIDWLNVSKKDIPGFSADSLDADKRLSVHLETLLYSPWSLLGFRFAPFVAIDAAVIDCISCNTPNEYFLGFSGGFRTRNENLIFGTMEVKVTYIPNNEDGESQFVFGFRQNIRVTNIGSFVRSPSLIFYN
jgi:hypothetical protein